MYEFYFCFVLRNTKIHMIWMTDSAALNNARGT